MILTFQLDKPNFYIETDDIILLFTDYEFNSEKDWVILYRDNVLICSYKRDFKIFKNEMLEAKKDFVRENINNKEELEEYEHFFMDSRKMITLIEMDSKKREE